MALPCIRIKSACTIWKCDNRNIYIILFWAFSMTKWSFSQKIFLITNHLDLIVYHLLTCFYLKGKKERKGKFYKWRVGLFCQHTKKGQPDKTPAKGFQNFKNALLSFGKREQAPYEWVSRENESALRTEEESWTLHLNLHSSNTNSTHSKERRALEANEQFPWPWQCMKTPDVSSKQVAEYTWYIWMGGQSVVPGRKWTPDRFGRCNRFSLVESQWGISVSRALETSPT